MEMIPFPGVDEERMYRIEMAQLNVTNFVAPSFGEQVTMCEYPQMKGGWTLVGIPEERYPDAETEWGVMASSSKEDYSYRDGAGDEEC